MKQLVVACVAGAWASALVATNTAGHELAWPIALLLWGVAASAIAGACIAPRIRRVVVPLALCLTAAALVASTALAQAPIRQPEFMRIAADAGRSVTISGLVLTTPREQQLSFGFDEGSRVLFGMRIDRVQLGSTEGAIEVSVPAQAFAQLDGDGSAPDIGARVLMTAKLVAGAPGEPNAFRAYARDALEVVEQPPWYLGWAAELRSTFRAASAALPGEGGTLLPGLAIGDTSAVSAVSTMR